jgi:hypothetical protein
MGLDSAMSGYVMHYQGHTTLASRAVGEDGDITASLVQEIGPDWKRFQRKHASVLVLEIRSDPVV